MSKTLTNPEDYLNGFGVGFALIGLFLLGFILIIGIILIILHRLEEKKGLK